MRRRLITVAAILVAMATGPKDRACAQDGISYQHRRQIFFPIPTDRLQTANPRPAKLRLWAAAPGQKWKLVAEKTPDNLDTNSPRDGGDGSRGFLFRATTDGEYEFASQQVYADGNETPREANLRAEFRVVFDTRPPSVQAAAYGSTGIEWDVRDEYLDPDSIGIEARYKDTNRGWTKVKDRLRPQDRFTWTNIPNGYQLEVRVVGKDRAGNEASSRVITLPTSGGSGLSGIAPATLPGAGRTGEPFARGGGSSYGDDIPTRPEIQYVNQQSFDVRSKITRITKSGIGKVVLWVRDEKTGWKEVREQTTSIRFEDPEPWVSIPFRAPSDGLYEFRVVPVSNATLVRGEKPEQPGKNDPAQIMVEVDTTVPEVTIRNVRVGPGGTGGPRVEIDYLAKDRNLIADNPVILEWSKDPAIDQWQIITRTRRDGPYVWDNVPENEWKLYLRARAVDKATGEGRTVWDKPVIVDLDRPEATIEKIERSGGGAIGDTNTEKKSTPPVITPNPKGGNSSGDLMGIPGLPGK